MEKKILLPLYAVYIYKYCKGLKNNTVYGKKKQFTKFWLRKASVRPNVFENLCELCYFGVLFAICYKSKKISFLYFPN